MDLDYALNLRKLKTFDRRTRKLKQQQQVASSVTSGTFLGIDSSQSVNGNPVGAIKTASGDIIRAAVITSGNLTGSLINVATPKGSMGFVTGMPAGWLRT